MELELSAARAAFDAAAVAAGGPVAADLVLARGRVRLEVADRALFDGLHAAVAHLESTPQAVHGPLLTIRACTSPVATAAMDPGPNGAIDVSDAGTIIRYRRRTSTAWLDRGRGELAVLFADAHRLSLYDRGKPLQLPLAVWQFDRGVPFVHAGVVARGGRGILLPGKGGSGKSTAAVSCALAGYDYLGDDCIAVEVNAPHAAGGVERTAVRAYSVYGTTTLAPHHLDRFETLRSHAIAGTTPDEEKHLIFLNRLIPRPLARTAEIAAVVIPRITGGLTSRLVPASHAQALRALAPSTVLFFPGHGARHMDYLARVIQAVPAYSLEMGTDLADIPRCLDRLLLD